MSGTTLITAGKSTCTVCNWVSSMRSHVATAPSTDTADTAVTTGRPSASASCTSTCCA